MANTLVNLVITAKNQASATLNQVAGALGGLGNAASGAAGSTQSMGDALFGAIAKANLLEFAIGKAGEAAALMGAKFEEAKKIEIGDVSAASTFSALTKQSFGDSQKFVSDFSKEISQVAGALPGATADYNRVANSIMDNVIPAFQDANGVLDQGKFKENLVDITKKMTLLGITSDTHSGAVGMFTARLLDGNIASAKQLLFADNNPAFMGQLEKALKAQGKTEKDFKTMTSKQRLEIIQAVSEQFISKEVIDAASNTVDGLLAAIESSFFDPKSGVFGLLRDLSEAKGNQTVMSAVAGGINAVQKFFGSVSQLLAAIGVPSVDPMLVLYNGINVFTGWVKNAANMIALISTAVKASGGGVGGLLKLVQGFDLSIVLVKVREIFTSITRSAIASFNSVAGRFNPSTFLKQVDAFIGSISGAINTFFAFTANTSGSMVSGMDMGAFALKISSGLGWMLGQIITKLVNFLIFLPWGDILVTIGNLALRIIPVTVGAIAGFFIGLQSSLMNGLRTILMSVGSALLNGVYTIGQTYLYSLREFWGWVGGTIWGWIAPATASIGNGISSFFGSLINGIASFVGSLINSTAAAAENWLDGAIANVTGFFDWLGNSIVQLWEGLKQAIFQAIENAKQQITSFVTAPLSTAGNFVGGVASDAANAVGGAASAVGGAASGVGSAVGGAASGVGSAIGGAFNSVFGGYNGHIPTAATGLLGAFASESRNMPGGASPVVANSSEFILRPDQMQRLMQGSAAIGYSQGNSVSIGNISINGIQNPAAIADAVIAEIEARLGQYQQSVLA